MTKLKKYITYSIYALLILHILTSLFAPQLTMRIFGFRNFIVISNSMEPDINVNDMIFIRRTSDEQLNVGDVITFQVYIPEVDEISYVTHYIGAIETDTEGTLIYKTRGARYAEGIFDEWTDENGNAVDITINDIEGVYMFRIPYIGYFITMLQDPIFVGLLVVNGTVIYVLYRTIKKTIQSKKDTI